jgi:hypothetical protein
MIIIFLIFLFIIYLFTSLKKETFIVRINSNLKNCRHLNGKIRDRFNIYTQRKNAYSNPKHKHFGIMRPILFYLWSHNNISSKNFKEERFEFDPNEFCNNDTTIRNQIDGLRNKTPYSVVRDNLKNIKLRQKAGKYLFKTDYYHPDDVEIENNKFFVFRENMSDMKGYDYNESNELAEEFYFNENINSTDDPNIMIDETSEEYHSRNNNLRVLDLNIDCTRTRTNNPHLLCRKENNKINKIMENTGDNEFNKDCCFLDNTTLNIGMNPQQNSQEILKSNDENCCNYRNSLVLVPESNLIMNFIIYAKNQLLENRAYYGFESSENEFYNIKENIIPINSSDKYNYETNSLISHIPEFILWDGFGIYVKKVDDTFQVHIINEDPSINNGQDFVISDWNEAEPTTDLEYDSLNNEPIFKNFIKNHFYVYRKNSLNFFEYMCLEFLKLANFPGRNGQLKDTGTDEYLVRNNEISDYGYSVAQELYKYHVKSENNFNIVTGISPLYNDLHIDYYTLTKWYGANLCNYFKYKALYEIENINFNWNICDIMKFVLNVLYLPYKTYDEGFNVNDDDTDWGTQLLDHYVRDFGCKIDIN